MAPAVAAESGSIEKAAAGLPHSIGLAAATGSLAKFKRGYDDDDWKHERSDSGSADADGKSGG